MLTGEQIELRQAGLGGSEMAIPVGLSSRMTARELYHVKRGEIEPIIDVQAAWMGHQVEPILARWYTEQTGWKVARRNKTYRPRDPALHWMIAHPDGFAVGPRGPDRRGVEFKLRGLSRGWGPSDSEEIPDEVMLQVQAYMAVTKRPLWDVVVCLGGIDLRRYTIPRDEPMIDAMIESGMEFMFHLTAGVEPAFDFNHPTTLALVERLHPGSGGRQIKLPEAAWHYHCALEDAKDRIKELTMVRDGAKAALLAMMGYAATGAFPDGSMYVRSEKARKGYTVEPTRYTDFRFMGAPK